MKKSLLEILEVKHLIALMITVTMLYLIIFVVLSGKNDEIAREGITILNNAFTMILGYLFGRQKHLDVNVKREDVL